MSMTRCRCSSLLAESWFAERVIAAYFSLAGGAGRGRAGQKARRPVSSPDKRFTLPSHPRDTFSKTDAESNATIHCNQSKRFPMCTICTRTNRNRRLVTLRIEHQQRHSESGQPHCNARRDDPCKARPLEIRLELLVFGSALRVSRTRARGSAFRFEVDRSARRTGGSAH